MKEGIGKGPRNVGLLSTAKKDDGVTWDANVDYSEDGEVIEKQPIKPPADTGASHDDDMDTSSDDSSVDSSDDSSVEEVVAQPRAKTNVSAARVIPGVSAVLLKAPKVKSLVTTQRASTYSKKKPPPAPGTTEGDLKPAAKGSKKSKKKGSQKRS